MKLLIIDGFSILFRNFFAMPNFYNVDGLPIGGVSGFVKTTLKIINNFNPDYCAIALDSGEPNWRHELYPQYKSNRKSTPEDLIPQFKILFEVCETLGIQTFKGLKCEADDWIASIAEKYKHDCSHVYVFSCDKDLMQLVKDNIFFIDPFKSTIMNQEDVLQKIGVYPSQIPDLFGLIGDSSDCIPGVPTIGIKTASKWISDFNTLEQIYDNVTKLTPNSRKNKLIEHYEQALLSRKLAQLVKDLELPEIASLKYQSQPQELALFVQKYKLGKHISI